MEQELQWMVIGAALGSHSWREDIIDKLTPDHFSGRARDIFNALASGDLPHRFLALDPHSPIVHGLVRLLDEKQEREQRLMTALEVETASKLMPYEQFLEWGKRRFDERMKAKLAALGEAK